MHLWRCARAHPVLCARLYVHAEEYYLEVARAA